MDKGRLQQFKKFFSAASFPGFFEHFKGGKAGTPGSNNGYGHFLFWYFRSIYFLIGPPKDNPVLYLAQNQQVFIKSVNLMPNF